MTRAVKVNTPPVITPNHTLVYNLDGKITIWLWTLYTGIIDFLGFDFEILNFRDSAIDICHLCCCWFIDIHSHSFGVYFPIPIHLLTSSYLCPIANVHSTLTFKISNPILSILNGYFYWHSKWKCEKQRNLHKFPLLLIIFTVNFHWRLGPMCLDLCRVHNWLNWCRTSGRKRFNKYRALG
jgi:hypothetical protein